MEWPKIVEQIREKRVNFEKSFKCLNKSAPITVNTKLKHIEILVGTYNEIRELAWDNRVRLTSVQSTQAKDIVARLREHLIYVSNRHNLHIFCPSALSTNANFDKATLMDDSGEAPSTSDKIEEIKIQLPRPLTPTIQITPLTPTTPQPEHPINMASEVLQFLKTASSLIPDFDGKPENLQSFLDALQLVDSIKESHEATAVNIIKTKLKGHVRNLISNESTISAICAKLGASVKGESVEVLSAKLLNLQQKNKTANQYTSEVDQLARALEGAYIRDGLPPLTANKYSTTQAVKAMSKNCSNDKVKLIMEAGTFNNMNDAIAKFVHSCTEATGHTNTVLYYQQRGNNQNIGRGNRGQGGGNYRGVQRYQNSNQRQNRYFQGNRGNGNQNNYNNNNRNQQRNSGYNNRNNQNRNNNVRIVQNNSENQQEPLGTQN